MGLWVKVFEIIFVVVALSGQLNGFASTVRNNTKRTLWKNETSYDKDSEIRYSDKSRTRFDTQNVRKSKSSIINRFTRNILDLNIESDDSNIRTNGNSHSIHAQYIRRLPLPIVLHRSTSIIRPREHIVSHKVDTETSLPANFSSLSKSNIPTKPSKKEILRNFMKPAEKEEQAEIATYITKHMTASTTNQTNQSESNATEHPGVNLTSGATLEDRRSSIFSFFTEENRGSFSNDFDLDNPTNFESNMMNSLESASENIPIITELIKGTLSEDIKAERSRVKGKDGINSTAGDYDIMLDNYYQAHNRSSNASVSTYNDEQVDSPTHNDNQNSSRINFKASEFINETATKDNVTYVDQIDVTDLLKVYKKINGERKIVGNKLHQNKTNEHRIEFYNINELPRGFCMDGSIPGYYLRKGFGNGQRKWIIHLHGGAWCYDLHSCLNRRRSILGSTLKSRNVDMKTFFHGLLSKSSRANTHFYNWNVAVLSYCDGGLFSGNRKRTITGKHMEFYFQGRGVLQSQLEDIQKRHLKNATDVVLSGTSAGGLALALQGDYIRNQLPKNIRVRGLIDAALFLNRNSTQGYNLAKQQFKALYSLHRPILNRKCLEKMSKKNKYLCLFPENSIRYLRLPVFIINSLYDHWQLSYLDGIDCIYDDVKRCNTKQHDSILSFRNQMYKMVSDIKRSKPDSGVFANSCFAHGQAILDYTWSKVKINNKNIANSFFDWYNGVDDQKQMFRADCKYPCNGSCPKGLAQKCVANFIGASEHRRKRDAELC